ncbi:MAG: hypothetical protein WBC91_00370 [Phototrophicaceae bacterium]
MMPPPSLPEQEAVYRNSKYQRRRHPFSLIALVIGLLIGLTGGWYYAYFINPTQEVSTRPDQLQLTEQEHYVVAIMLAYGYDSDLGTAINRLASLEFNADPVQEVANIACNLARTGYVDSSSGLRAVRAMRTFYQLQGRTGCADTIVPDPQSVPLQVAIQAATPTQTLPPPPTKTPASIFATETPSGIVVVPTNAPQRTYNGFITETFCSVELSGIIEFRVRLQNAEEIAGEPIRVAWENNQSNFVTGLKPERGIGYADFQMEDNLSYIVSMPGLSDPIPSTLVADTCFTLDTNEQAITSYRVVFVRN